MTSGGNVSDFSWSPNGKLLAWAHESDFVWESISIWNSQEQTTKTFLLSEKIDWLYDLKWSQDGKQLYLGGTGAIFDIPNEKLFLLPEQEVEGEEFFGFSRSFNGEYLVLRRYLDFLHGQPDLIITKNNKPTYIGYEFGNPSVYSWSPNENILAWTGSPIPKDLQEPEKDYDTVLLLTNAPTGETIKHETGNSLYTCCDDIFWSKDGMSLAILASDSIEIIEFAKTDNGFPISIADQFQLDIHDLVNNYNYMNGGLSWSPDGKQLIVGRNYQLWLIDVQGNKKQNFSIDFH